MEGTTVGETPKKSCWDQAAVISGTSIMQIIINALGVMQEDKHNCYLGNEELDAILPATGYAIIIP